MNTFLTEVKGFTPVIDALAKEFGLVTAAVYGVVWRYCQMEDKVCKASLETIAEHLNINRSTVLRHIEILCEHGYVKDLTPSLRNVPHTYANTGKAKIAGLVEATVADDNSETVAQNNSLPQTVAQNNATVAESHLKRDSKRDSKNKKVKKDSDYLTDVLNHRPGKEAIADSRDDLANHFGLYRDEALNTYTRLTGLYP